MFSFLFLFFSKKIWSKMILIVSKMGNIKSTILIFPTYFYGKPNLKNKKKIFSITGNNVIAGGLMEK